MADSTAGMASPPSDEASGTMEALWAAREQRRSEGLRRLRETALVALVPASLGAHGGSLAAFEGLIREKERMLLPTHRKKLKL